MSSKVYGRPTSLNDTVFTYCPGCGHGVANRLIAELMDEMGFREECVGVTYVGCGTMIYDNFECDFTIPLHGRAPAVATGIKRVMPDKVVFVYQGDGDLAAIGTGEIIHAAARGENITVFFINNGNYGMTGGQMAPTTLLGQVTSTTPDGRDAKLHGYPIRICEMLAELDGTSFIARTALDTVRNINETKKMMKKALEYQINGKGFSFVEILAPCPVGWKMSPLESRRRITEEVTKVYPLGIIKSID